VSGNTRPIRVNRLDTHADIQTSVRLRERTHAGTAPSRIAQLLTFGSFPQQLQVTYFAFLCTAKGRDCNASQGGAGAPIAGTRRLVSRWTRLALCQVAATSREQYRNDLRRAANIGVLDGKFPRQESTSPDSGASRTSVSLCQSASTTAEGASRSSVPDKAMSLTRRLRMASPFQKKRPEYFAFDSVEGSSSKHCNVSPQPSRQGSRRPRNPGRLARRWH
jgi:hypothetical protein